MDESPYHAAVIDWIQKNHDLGDSAGGSGHMGFTSYHLNKILLQENILEVTYTIIVETEFTYYPDIPPIETTYLQLFSVQNNTIVPMGEPKVMSTNQDIEFLPEDLEDF